MNDATSLIRHNINGVLANRLVMRIGNRIARATFNENDNASSALDGGLPY